MNCTARSFVHLALRSVLQQLSLAGVPEDTVQAELSYHFDPGFSVPPGAPEDGRREGLWRLLKKALRAMARRRRLWPLAGCVCGPGFALVRPSCDVVDPSGEPLGVSKRIQANKWIYCKNMFDNTMYMYIYITYTLHIHIVYTKSTRIIFNIIYILIN